MPEHSKLPLKILTSSRSIDIVQGFRHVAIAGTAADAKLIVDSVNKVKLYKEAFNSLYYFADKLASRAGTDDLQRCITDLTRPLYEYKKLYDDQNAAFKQEKDDV